MWYGSPKTTSASGAGHAQELGHVALDLGHGRDVLQRDARVDEVERVRLQLAEVGRRVDPELAALEAGVQVPRLLDHRRGDVDADRLLEAGAEGARQPADAGAEVERPPAARRPVERLGDREDVRDLGLAGGEELVHVPAPALAARTGQHRPQRIDLGQAVPVLLVALEARRAESPYRRPTTSGSGRSSAPSARIQGCRSPGSCGFSITNANRFACRGRTRVIPVTTGRASAQHARAGALVDLDKRLRQLELAEEPDPVAGVRRERGDRLLDLALRPAVDVVRRARVRDAAGAEAVRRRPPPARTRRRRPSLTATRIRALSRLSSASAATRATR